MEYMSAIGRASRVSSDRTRHTLEGVFDEDDMESYVVNNVANHMRLRTSRYVVGFTLEGLTLIAWFNNQFYHSAPLSLNLAYNALLTAKLGENGTGSIQFSNWPIAFRNNSYGSLIQTGYDLSFQFALIIPYAMAFVMAAYVIFYIQERTLKVKLLQYMSGVATTTMWLASFLFDFFLYILLCLVFYAMLVIYQEDGWYNTRELQAVFLVLFIFGLSALTLTILLSRLFIHTPAGYASLAIFYALTGKYFPPILTVLTLECLVEFIFF